VVHVSAPNVTVENTPPAGPQEIKITEMPDRRTKTTTAVKRDGVGQIKETETYTEESDV